MRLRSDNEACTTVTLCVRCGTAGNAMSSYRRWKSSPTILTRPRGTTGSNRKSVTTTPRTVGDISRVRLGFLIIQSCKVWRSLERLVKVVGNNKCCKYTMLMRGKSMTNRSLNGHADVV
ncbi:unnamed protein product [Choristocarpus tenellus]